MKKIFLILMFTLIISTMVSVQAKKLELNGFNDYCKMPDGSFNLLSTPHITEKKLSQLESECIENGGIIYIVRNA